MPEKLLLYFCKKQGLLCPDKLSPQFSPGQVIQRGVFSESILLRGSSHIPWFCIFPEFSRQAHTELSFHACQRNGVEKIKQVPRELSLVIMEFSLWGFQHLLPPDSLSPLLLCTMNVTR